ncbi:Crp/Fnr family transcriptional regulator [Putridiphycobacter roseus]|uniref:Crp/Fnr family transcriptional regulator n=1 Tax=Putridiphycobacter roseus TaxID=2219161 RepID=A0A2W1NNC5_9FLAO|nr:Crp/Fnr family transcriptional regulator [Putridiphycobacter roseus]PZE16088.1 Crp/Fnr family transcriptional regulator [Putridiphycobacter roseus]
MSFNAQFDFKSSHLLKGLNKTELDIIQKSQETLRFSNGDKIFYEEGIPTGIYQLISGKVKKYKTVLNHQQQIFYIYSKGDLFGYHALLSDERYQDSCEALGNVVVNFISRNNFLAILEEIPALKDALIINMAHEFGVLANIIGVLSQKSQNVRLALFLLLLQNRFSAIHPDFKGVDLTREDLANIVGTSRESLSRSINHLKKEKFISVNKRLITVIDIKGIEAYIYN